MSIKKVCGTVAALVLFSGYSGAVLADQCADDRDAAITATVELASELACELYPEGVTGILGTWNKDNPIWQFRPRKGGNGCEIHYKLNKKLNELPQNNTKPGKCKSKIDSRGVAALLEDGKDQNAFDMLQQFMDTIMYNARVNPGYDETKSPGYGKDAAEAAQYFVNGAYNIQTSVNSLLLYCQ